MAAAVIGIDVAFPGRAEAAALHATACVQCHHIAGIKSNRWIVGETAINRRILDLPNFVAGRRLRASNDVRPVRIVVDLTGQKTRRWWRSARVSVREM